MDTEKDFEELTGAGVDTDDTAALTEVEEELPEDGLLAEADPALVDPEDDGAFGGEEDSEEAEISAYMLQDYEER
jgi:hypothetical protein